MKSSPVHPFFAKYEIHTLRPYETFLHAGDEPKGVYFLESGHVRQYDISARTGAELTLHVFNPGSFFPLMWAINTIPNRYFYQTMDAANVRIAPRQALQEYLKAHPEELMDLTKRLLHGLDGMILRLQNQVFGDAYTRVISELLYLARHFGRKEGKKIVIGQHFTHQNLADLTGAVRETVSVAMEKLQERSLISYRGRSIVINDHDQLEREMEKYL